MRFATFGLAAVLAFSGRAAAADWPTFRADAARGGYTAEQLPEVLWPLWTYRSAQAPMPAWPTRTRQRYDVAYQPVMAAGMLYFGSSADGKVYGLDALSGRTRWRFFTDGPVRFAPAAWEDRLYVVSDDGHLYCLDARNGTLRWKLRAGPRADMLLGNDRMIARWPARGGPVIADATVYFGAGIWPSEGIFLYAVDARSGKVIWRNDACGSIEMDQPHPTARANSGIAIQGYLAVAGDSLLVPTGRAVPAVFDRQSGRLRHFQLQSNGQLGGADVVAIDENYFVNTAAFLGRNGASAGRVGTVVAAHPDFIVTSQGGKLQGVDRRNPLIEKDVVDRKGEKKRINTVTKPAWTIALPADFGLAPPVLKGSETPAGELMKSTNWSTPSIAGEPAALIIAGNRAVGGGQNQVLMADLPSRKVLWTAEVDGAACGLGVADGKLYASTDRGTIYCFSGVQTAGPAILGPPQNTPPSTAGDIYAAAAEEVVRRTGITSGYCLDLGCGDGRLALQLARRCPQLHIHGLEQDPAKVEAARNLLDQAGLYGTRVTILQGDPRQAHYPDYFADLVVSGRCVAEGPGAAPPAWFKRMQRPCGGIACIGKPGAMEQTVRGPLPGAASWTHQNTDPANTFCSADTVVRGPLGMLWFRDTDFVMANRHGRSPAPLVDNGRMIVEGLHGLRAVNIYNGRTLWEFPLENVLLTYHREHSVGAAWVGSNYCLAGDSVYVHDGKRCLRLDAASGRQTAEFLPPKRPDGKPGTWTYIACDGKLLFGTLANEEYLVRCWSHEWDTSGQFIESVLFFALDAQTGKTLWTFQPRESLRNNAIAVSGGRVYLIDRPLAQVDDLRHPLAATKAEARRRAAASGKTEEEEFGAVTQQPPGRLLALEGRTGKTLWTVDREVFGTQLAVSEEHGLLLMSYQPAHQASLAAERGDRMAALRTADGTRVWDVEARYVARPILNDRTIYAEPGAWDLLSGKAIPFNLERSYGCGIPCGSRNMLLFRSATLAYMDLKRDSQAVNYGGIRPGCWVNLIPAGGLVLMPDAASWCTCSYLNQATIALKPQGGP